MKTFRQLNYILGWAVFAFASWVYLSTIEPTASWWDCGEYIATAFKLQVGHPPGAPFFQLMGRFFSLLAFGDTMKVAMMINVMSALSSAATILFLYWSITMLGLKIGNGDDLSKGRMYAILGSGLVGALAYTFSDSFWFSAVEGEVYAMSSFFTAIVFWAILKWDRVADQPHSTRWILLIAFLMGLSIGVHLLNLLAIPAITLVFYFRKYKPTIKGTLISLGVSFVLLAIVMYVIIPYTVKLAGKYEITFVNDFGLPFNTGTLFYFIVLIGTLVWGIRFTYKVHHTKAEYAIGILLLLLLSIFSWGTMLVFLLVCGIYYWYKSDSGTISRTKMKVAANTALLSMAFILIGYSSFFLLVIRANANTPINENAPSDAVSLLSYLLREQYGSWPIFYGQYYNAPLDRQQPYKDGPPTYVKDEKQGKYIVTNDGKNSQPNYDKRFCTIFPRMWSSDQERQHVEAYKIWGGVSGTPISVTDENGKQQTLNKPTFGENLQFFFKYQVGHMYMRYLFWNFVGRQNDIQGEGGIRYGNWISGIPMIDNAKLGDQSNLPASFDNWARNKFYFLPLLLGMLGLLFQLRKNGNQFLVVFLLFFMTGIAIVMYLNITPNQPRERDYAFAGSFYAFAMWIGLGVMALWDLVKKINHTYSPIIITLVCLLLVPGIMAKEGWNDHDRSGKYAARDFARNYLNSCAPNAILITNGDNDTFPLWYAQEVEGVRTDVRVVNFMLASSDWYAHQLMRKLYNSDPLPFTLTYDQYNKGVNDISAYSAMTTDRVELKELIKFIASDDPMSKYKSDGRTLSLYPTKKIKITLDSTQFVKNGIIPAQFADRAVGTINLDIKPNYLYKNDLMLLDFIANNQFKRPIYFASPASIGSVDFSNYCFLDGFVYRFMPAKAQGSDFYRGYGSVDVNGSYDVLMNKCQWGNLADPKVYVDRESYRNSMIPKQNFARLASKLVEVGNKDSAVKVCDRLQEIFPDNKIHFDYYYLQFVNIYYQAGAFDKGNKLANRLFEIYEQNTNYIYSLKPPFRDNYSDDLNDAYTFFTTLKQFAGQYGQTAMADRADKMLKQRFGGQ